jgi:hypothetical protein
MRQSLLTDNKRLLRCLYLLPAKTRISYGWQPIAWDAARVLINQQAMIMLTQRHIYHLYRHSQQRQWGLSLVPVIISIAIFTALAIHYSMPKQFQQQSANTITSTQVVVAQILQAALDYRVINKDWPEKTGDLIPNHLAFINNNPWGNGWHFISPASNQGMVLATEAGDNLSAMALASKFGAIARVCNTQSTTHVPCSSNEVGTWVYIGIAPP